MTEKAMAPHSSTLAWKLPWTEEPGRLQSMGSLRVGHDWATSLFIFMHWRRKCTHSSALAWRIPGTGEPGGLPSMGLHRVGPEWSDLAAAAAAADISSYFHHWIPSTQCLAYIQCMVHFWWMNKEHCSNNWTEKGDFNIKNFSGIDFLTLNHHCVLL